MKHKGKYNPINPVVLSTTNPAPNVNSHDDPVLSCVVGDNSDLIRNVARLWISEQDRVLDPTFGRGVFWKKLENVELTSHDIKKDDVDCRRLPYGDESFDVVVLDPPYRPTHGSEKFNGSGNGLQKAYQLGLQSLDTINDVIDLYRSSIKEAWRVLSGNGRVLVKCQDLSYGHRLHLVSLDILNIMISTGFDFADQFVLFNNSRLSSGAWKKQERSRRAHSILWVGLKVNA